MNVIGLTGYAGAGKDYVCDLLRTQFDNAGLMATRIAFADGVKQDIEETLGLSDFAAKGITATKLREKPYSPEIRKLLQWWGTDLRRAEDEDYWVKLGIAQAGVEWNMGGADLIIFTDVRFQNEADVIHNAGGLVFQVVAEDSLRAERVGGTLPPSHASEVIDFEVDGIIQNSGMTEYPIELVLFLDGII